MREFTGSNNYKKEKRILIKEKETSSSFTLLNSIEDLFDKAKIKDGMTLSFHHHLRNGDYVLIMALDVIKKRNLKNMTIAASSIFPNNKILAELIKNENVTNIYCNYINGEASRAITDGYLKGEFIMNTHGGRHRSIESGEIKIDVAILGMPSVDKEGNGTGRFGKSACGSIGYAIPDIMYAKKVALVTDNYVEKIDNPECDGKYVDYVVIVDSIGDSAGIVSGTTKITKDPVGLKIARDTAKLLYELGAIKDGFTMQTGAGGTSLAVASYVRKIMLENSIKGKFATGGITSYFVNMLNDGLLDELWDVQCFDLDAVKSIASNPKHHFMSASLYANAFDPDAKVNELDFAILGATEIDLNFNVNVTTDSHGAIIGGSGGHSDVANGAKITIIVTNLVKSRMPIIKKHVTTITTPGEDVDVLVTERGIAINPKRQDLLEKVKASKLNILPIEELFKIEESIVGSVKDTTKGTEVVGYVMYRDGTIIDKLYKTN